MPSVHRRRWWHATIEILDRIDGPTLVAMATGRIDDVTINSYLYAYAFADEAAVCTTPVSIPVPAFDPFQSGGYFVFRPPVLDLIAVTEEVFTYQDVINLNKRKVFEFFVIGAYDPLDPDCSATEPTALDPAPYTPIAIETLNSNIFKYPVLDTYTQIGCCLLNVDSGSPLLATPGTTSSPTRLWYLMDSPSAGDGRYSIVSYDFALTTGQLVNRGVIDRSISPDVELFDITWIPSDNSLLVLTSDGIRRLFPGTVTTSAILGDILPFTDCDQCEDFGIVFPMNQNDGIRKCFEYNWYTDKILMFSTRRTKQSETEWLYTPYYFEMNYNRSGLNVTSSQSAQITSPTDVTINNIGGFAFSSNAISSLNIIDNTLYSVRIETDANFGTPSIVGVSGTLGGMKTISFVADPIGESGENLLCTSNVSGQQFIINQTTGDPIIVSGPVLSPGTAIGCTTSLNGEDTRVSPFPFLVGSSHWLFLIQISASMAGPKLDRIRIAIDSLLSSYTRHGDTITIAWYNDTNGQITKELRTVSDSTEVSNYLNTYIVASSTVSNLYSTFSNISQSFTTLKNLFIFSDGACTDCDSSQWKSNFDQAVDSILAQNSQAQITVVGVNAIDNEKIKYIADRAALQSRGIYTTWNQ